MIDFSSDQLSIPDTIALAFVDLAQGPLLDCAETLADQGCTGIDGGVIVVMGTGDKPRITAAQFGCNCADCCEAAVTAVRIAFDPE